MHVESTYTLVTTAALVAMLVSMAGWSGLMSPVTSFFLGGIGAAGVLFRAGLSGGFPGAVALTMLVVGLLWGAGCMGYALAMDRWRHRIGRCALLTLGVPIAPIYIPLVPRLWRVRRAMLEATTAGAKNPATATRAVQNVETIEKTLEERRAQQGKPKRGRKG